MRVIKAYLHDTGIFVPGKIGNLQGVLPPQNKHFDMVMTLEDGVLKVVTKGEPTFCVPFTGCKLVILADEEKPKLQSVDKSA